MDKCFMMEIHHGGKFVNHPMLYYKGGKIDYMYNIDPDRMSYEELKGIMSVDYRYNDVCKIYYNVMGRSFAKGLRLIVNDTSILQMLAEVTDNGGIEIYTEHGVMSEGESEVESESGADDEDSDSDSSVASLDNVSDNEELIEVRRMAAIRKCGKNVADDKVTDHGGNNVAEHGDDETEHGENVTQIGENVTETVTERVQKDDNHKHGENMESDEDKGVEYVGRSDAFAMEAEWNSSENDSPISDEDEQYGEKKQFIVYKHKPGGPQMEPVLGMIFCKPDDLKHCLRSYAVAHGYPIKFKRNEGKRLLAICAEGCPWRLWATYMQTENSFQIKSYKPNHKCIRNFRLKIINSKWLAKQYGAKFINNPRWKLKDIKADVLEKYSIDVSLSVCHRAKKSALGEVEKSLIEHYAKVWDYGAEILRSNEGSTVKISIDMPIPNGPRYFHRMYVCLLQLKRDG